MFRVLAFLAIAAAASFAQPPRGYFPWWDRPLAEDLKLTDAQKQQVRSITREYRQRLQEARAAVDRADQALDTALNEDTVNEPRAMQAVHDLASARQQLTAALSEMSVRLRMALNADQWKELQRRRAERAGPQRRPMMRRQGGAGTQ